MLPKNLTACDKVLDEIGVAESFMVGLDYEAFESNEMLKRVVCMTVVNIGELVKNRDGGFRAWYPEVPWKAIAGNRCSKLGLDPVGGLWCISGARALISRRCA